MSRGIQEDSIVSFFINCNKDMIKGTTGYIEDLLVDIRSLGCDGLDIAPMGYGTTKMSFLYNSYIKPGSIEQFYKECEKSKKLTVVFDFISKQGCLKSLILVRDKTSGPFTRAKAVFRAADISKKIVPDLFLIKFILENNPCYEHKVLTLYIAQGYILPAAIANTYDTLLGIHRDRFKDTNPLHRKILSYIRTSEEFDLNNHSRVMGGYFKLLEYKYRELNNIPVAPVTYKECKRKLEVIING